MQEFTYVRSHDHCEVFVAKERDGTILGAYCWRDSPPEIEGNEWIFGINPVFLVASNPVAVALYVAEWFNEM